MTSFKILNALNYTQTLVYNSANQYEWVEQSSIRESLATFDFPVFSHCLRPSICYSVILHHSRIECTYNTGGWGGCVRSFYSSVLRESVWGENGIQFQIKTYNEVHDYMVYSISHISASFQREKGTMRLVFRQTLFREMLPKTYRLLLFRSVPPPNLTVVATSIDFSLPPSFLLPPPSHVCFGLPLSSNALFPLESHPPRSPARKWANEIIFGHFYGEMDFYCLVIKYACFQ